MNVLLIGDSSGNDDEGMKRIGRRLAEALCRRSIQASFMSLRTAFSQASRSAPPKVIHFLVGPTWRTFIASAALRQWYGAQPKVIVSFVHPHWSPLALAMFRTFRPDAVLAQSERWIEYCSSRVQTWTDPISGIDCGRFAAVSAERKRTLRKALGLSGNKKIVLHVGHLMPGRNLGVLRNLVGKDKSVLVIGSTTTRADVRVVALLRNAGVRVIHEYLPNVHEYYQAADCYVFPTVDARSCIEVPLSVLEALACGLPVVSTKFGGLPYYLPDDSSQLRFVDAVSALEPTVMAALSATEIVQCDVTRFSWDAVAASMETMYTNVVDS